MEDMVALRLKLTPDTLITGSPNRKRKFVGMGDQFTSLLYKSGARSPSELFTRIIVANVQRISPAIQQIGRCELRLADELHEALRHSKSRRLPRQRLLQFQSEVSEVRHIALRLRRYVHPQAEALLKLSEYSKTDVARDSGLLSKTDSFMLANAAAEAASQVEELQTTAELIRVLDIEIQQLRLEESNMMPRNFTILGGAAGVVSLLGLVTLLD